MIKYYGAYNSEKYTAGEINKIHYPDLKCSAVILSTLLLTSKKFTLYVFQCYFMSRNFIKHTLVKVQLVTNIVNAKFFFCLICNLPSKNILTKKKFSIFLRYFSFDSKSLFPTYDSSILELSESKI